VSTPTTSARFRCRNRRRRRTRRPVHPGDSSRTRALHPDREEGSRGQIARVLRPDASRALRRSGGRRPGSKDQDASGFAARALRSMRDVAREERTLLASSGRASIDATEVRSPRRRARNYCSPLADAAGLMLRGSCSERPFVSSLSRRTISVAHSGAGSPQRTGASRPLMFDSGRPSCSRAC
jgi:hypothetical protein